MAAIRGKGNRRTEIRLIELMKAHRIIGWRRNWPLEGKPDFVFPKSKVAVFVDGCFWHRCPRHFQPPAQNAEFWESKIGRNCLRDRVVNRLLKVKGWRVVRLWECDLRQSPDKVIRRLLRELAVD